MREFSDQRQILRRVTGPDSRIIFVKHYIEYPMRRVFNSPMTSHLISGPFSVRRQAGDIVSPFNAHLIVKFTLRYDHNQTAQPTPFLFFVQPLWRFQAIDATRFLTTMSALICFENISCFGRAFFLRSLPLLLRRAFSFKDAFDFRSQIRMIILEREHVIGALFANLFGNILLRAHRVNCHYATLDMEQAQQFGDSRNLIRLPIDFDLSESQTIEPSPGADQMDRALSRTPVMRAAQRLAINCNYLSISQSSDSADPRDEALLEFSGVQLGKDITKGIVRWNSVRQLQKGAKPVHIGFTPLFHFGEVLGSTDRRQDGDSNDVDQLVALVLIISARIGQLREIVQYCLGFCLFIFFRGHCGFVLSTPTLAIQSTTCKIMTGRPL